MKVLVARNAYQHPGGEDTVFHNETELLRSVGHEIKEFRDDNHRIAEMSSVSLGAQTIWSESSRRKLRAALDEFRPDIVHFHNFFPLISPAAYYACHEAGIPVVQTLHNYRLLCPGGILYRDGHVCEDCLPKRMKWPGALHACYRGDRLATATVATMLAVHHSLGTWREKVTQFIALSEFSRRKFSEGGLPAEKIAVKPNFASSDAGVRDGAGQFALFVGRLSSEKGVECLLEAWVKGNRRIPLRIVGDGPLRPMLEREKLVSGLDNVFFDGTLERTLVLKAMKQALFIVFPSNCYECFPLVIAEAYACGVPVIAARLGVMAEIVHDGVTGLHFETDSAEDLAAKVQWAWTHAAEMEEMGRAARAEYEAKYTPERNYKILMEIYERAICTTRSVERPSE
ncbi:MAG TPA: glycosyltransferase family 4 protein [Candidatus Acidoferrum sp.]|nr:glycosyltransferase family 4 protein [Candidatus Acidoferrum sp.]